MEYVGIGGWLLIATISLIFGLFVQLTEVTEFYRGYKTLISQDSSNNKGTLFLFDYTYLSSVGLILFKVVVILLLVLKKKILPNTIVVYYISNVIVAVSIGVILNDIPNLPSEFYDSMNEIWTPAVYRAILVGVIWSIYFKSSVRVKNTFVNELWNRKEKLERMDSVEKSERKLVNKTNYNEQDLPTESKNSPIMREETVKENETDIVQSTKPTIQKIKSRIKSRKVVLVFCLLFLIALTVGIYRLFFYESMEKIFDEKKALKTNLKHYNTVKDIDLSLKYSDNFFFYNIKIYGKYYDIINPLRSFDEGYIIVHLKDNDGFNIENIHISAKSLIRDKGGKSYYFGDKTRMSPEIYSKISSARFTSNFLFKDKK